MMLSDISFDSHIIPSIESGVVDWQGVIYLAAIELIVVVLCGRLGTLSIILTI
jgi:hypothetical protein